MPELDQAGDEVVDFPGTHFGDALVAAIVFTGMVVALFVALRLAGMTLAV